MSDKLRECPFCGDVPIEDVMKDSYYRDRFTIECFNCGLQMWDIAKDSLHRDWNTRTTPKHETVEHDKLFREARQLLIRVLEMDGDLYQTCLGGDIREYVAETQDSRLDSNT